MFCFLIFIPGLYCKLVKFLINTICICLFHTTASRISLVLFLKEKIYVKICFPQHMHSRSTKPSLIIDEDDCRGTSRTRVAYRSMKHGTVNKRGDWKILYFNYQLKMKDTSSIEHTNTRARAQNYICLLYTSRCV